MQFGFLLQSEKNIVVSNFSKETIITATIPSKEVKKQEFKNEITNDIKYFDVIVTYYTNNYESCGKTDGIGANNKKLNYGHIALPKEFPFGTKINLEGMGTFECQDRGGAIKRIDENTIVVDVYIPNATEAQLNQLGRKEVKGYIISN